MSKKSNIYVVILVIVVSIIGFYISSRHARVEIFYPEHDTVLTEDDYQVDTGNGILMVGKATWDEAARAYPEGENLGMSTVFRPDIHDCLLTFSKHENILTKIHIDDPALASSKGVRIGDSYTVVQEQYGKYYTQVKKADNKNDFDMIYGKNRENSITFQIRNNKVDRIVIQREVQ